MQRGWSSGEGPGFVERRAEVRGAWRAGEQREEGLEDEEQEAGGAGGWRVEGRAQICHH